MLSESKNIQNVTDMLQNVGRELRTQLNTLSGMCRAFEKTNDPEKIKHCFEHAKAAVFRLEKLAGLCESETNIKTAFIDFKMEAAEDFEFSIEKKFQNRPFENKRILFAEENEIAAEIVFDLLENSGVILERAADGAELVKTAVSSFGKYDLILTGIHLPKINGTDAARRIHAADESIPVVALTAEVLKSDIERLKSSGINSFVTKPLGRYALYKTLNKYLTNSGEKNQKNIISKVDYESFLEYINIDNALFRLQNNRKLFKHLLSNFPGAEIFSRICQSIEKNDLGAAVFETHTLAGIAANLSLIKIYEAAISLEKSISHSNDFSKEQKELSCAVMTTGAMIKEILFFFS